MTSPSAPTLAESLRRRDAEWIATLLEARPDLTSPAPHDFGELGARALTRSSIRRCLDHLDAWHLAVLETACALPEPVDPTATARLLNSARGHTGRADKTRTLAAFTHLTRLALIWPSGDGWRVPLPVREEFGPHPCGLAEAPQDATGDNGATEPGDSPPQDLPTAERAVLERLAQGPPVGSLKTFDESTPVGRLVAAGLLRHVRADTGTHTVELPRPVALALRAARPTTPVAPVPADFTVPGRGTGLVDQSGAGAALEIVGDIEGLLDELESAPVELLRDGGIGVRDLGRLARRIGRDTTRTGFLLELALWAGLTASRAGHTHLTTAADTWFAADLATRWATLSVAWRGSSRWWPSTGHARRHPWADPATVDQNEPPDPSGLRRLTLDLLASRPGLGIDATALGASIAHRRPAFARQGPPPVEDVLLEAGWLGIMALDTVTALAPFTVLDDVTTVAEAARSRFPEPVGELIVQADLTAIAPGPLRHDLAVVARRIAEVESRGGATVFRFTRASVQRALDDGWSASELIAWVSEHSSTEVPQPLHYLISDVSRRHGQIRLGTTSCWITMDDPAHLTLALADAGAAALGVTRIAETVLVADAEPDDVVAWLRGLGLSPSAAGGRPAPRRVSAPNTTERPPRPDTHAIAELIVRRARAAKASREIPLMLRRALEAGELIDLGYVASDGTRRHAQAVPIRMSDGSVHLVGPDTRLSLPLARILQVNPTASR